MTSLHRYRHYGLAVAANVALPGLPESEFGTPDVRIDITRAHERPLVDDSWTAIGTQPGAWRSPAGAGSRLRLQFEALDGAWGDLVIDDRGETMRLTLDESADLDDACELLTATVFSCVLSQRGLTCLHASVVAIEDRAIALIGAKGAGKSTLALALARRGGRLVSDDVAAVSLHDELAWVAVGRAALRMRPDSAATLGAGFTVLRPVWATAPPSLDKRYYEAADDMGACAAQAAAARGCLPVGTAREHRYAAAATHGSRRAASRPARKPPHGTRSGSRGAPPRLRLPGRACPLRARSRADAPR